MSVYPEVRVYADPFEGLTVQLSELRGLIKIVPPLIEADRERRWEEIGSRPGDPDGPEMIDIYEVEAGREEGAVMPGVGSTARAVIVIDEQGIVRHRHDHRLGLDYQTVDELKTALDSPA